jgi:hypothetical protein
MGDGTRGRRKRYGNGLRRLVLACVAALVLAGAPLATSYGTSSGETVTLTRAEADSIRVYIAELETRVELLQINLKECQDLAQADAVFADERARMMTEYYDNMVKDLGRENWVRRTLGHPMVWFVLGGYLGVKAATEN